MAVTYRNFLWQPSCTWNVSFASFGERCLGAKVLWMEKGFGPPLCWCWARLLLVPAGKLHPPLYVHDFLQCPGALACASYPTLWWHRQDDFEVVPGRGAQLAGQDLVATWGPSSRRVDVCRLGQRQSYRWWWWSLQDMSEGPVRNQQGQGNKSL